MGWRRTGFSKGGIRNRVGGRNSPHHFLSLSFSQARTSAQARQKIQPNLPRPPFKSLRRVNFAATQPDVSISLQRARTLFSLSVPLPLPFILPSPRWLYFLSLSGSLSRSPFPIVLPEPAREGRLARRPACLPACLTSQPRISSAHYFKRQELKDFTRTWKRLGEGGGGASERARESC